VAAIQQLRQDSAVSLPEDLGEELDQPLSQAVDAYRQGNNSKDMVASVYYRETRDHLQQFLRHLERAARDQQVDPNTVEDLIRQANAIIQELNALLIGLPVNSSPVADAGRDQIIDDGSMVQLDGSGSSDADGDSLLFSWLILAEPPNSNASLSDTMIVNPVFDVNQAGIYEIELIVNDGFQNSAPDTVTIDVALDNSAPVANAGPDQTVMIGEKVELDATSSSDADGDSLSFAWSLSMTPSGSSAALSDAAALKPTVVADLPGTYVAELVVNDGETDSDVDSVTITTLNSAPVADAGMDQSVLVGQTVSLDGSGSSDVDGDRLSFDWSLTRSPAGSTVILHDATAAQPYFRVDLPGLYTVRLVVNDGVAESEPDTVSITTLNVAPVADAGMNQSVFVGDTVTLDGSASGDADGDPLSFQWSLTHVPDNSDAEFGDPTAMHPVFAVDRTGTYLAQLIVNDGTVNSAPATVTITTKNSPPVADAGIDQEAFVDDTVTLDGRNSHDADFDDLTFGWSFTNVPDGSAVVFPDPLVARPQFVPDLPGLYIAQLTVNDGSVDSDPDTVRIIIYIDSDGDGLSDDDENSRGTDPNDPDSDNDGLDDGEEVNEYGTNPLDEDTDDDALNDGEEVNDYRTNPLDEDTDGDGVDDGTEVAQGTDPLKKKGKPPKNPR